MDVARAVWYVVGRARVTGRRSVLAIPIVGERKNVILDNIVNMAVNENIVVVTAAGKKIVCMTMLITSYYMGIHMCVYVYMIMYVYVSV